MNTTDKDLQELARCCFDDAQVRKPQDEYEFRENLIVDIFEALVLVRDAGKEEDGRIPGKLYWVSDIGPVLQEFTARYNIGGRSELGESWNYWTLVKPEDL